MYREDNLCRQFGQILRGEAKMEDGACTVTMDRRFHVTVQGHPATHLGDVEIWFESLGHNGNALNFGEVTVLQEEVPRFTSLLIHQGIMVGAIHNHWIFTVPEILYVHFQTIEPPLNFARKVAYAFTALRSYPQS